MIYDAVNIGGASWLLDQRLIESLHQDRREKIACLRSNGDKVSSVAAWTLLQVAIDSEYPDVFGFDINDEVVDYGIFGKPFFTERQNVQFSLSHANGAVMCALSEKPVGCDVEAWCRFAACDEAFLKCVLHRNEAEIVMLYEGETVSRLLCALWTMKEAYTKKRGTGLNQDFSSLDFSREISQCFADGHASSAMGTFDLRDCRFSWYEKSGYSLCSCAEDKLLYFGDCRSALKIWCQETMDAYPKTI